MSAWLRKDKRYNRELKTRNKYGASAQVVNGRRYDSGLEARTHEYLLWLEKAGELRDIRCQVVLYLTPARIAYRADFVVHDIALGEDVAVEAKGLEGERWKIIKKLWPEYGPMRLRVYKDAGKGEIRMTDEIVPKMAVEELE